MKLAAALVVIAALSSPGRAEAQCGTPRWLGTPSGAQIPQRGVLFLYDEGLGHRDARPMGGAIKSETRISDTMMRLDYATTADELELADPVDPRVYSVKRKWVAPASAPRVLQYWHHVHAWTCSSADSLMLQIDQPTAAFRVRWKVAGKEPQEWIIPARASDANASVLELGKINCGSTTIEPEELARGGELSLIAIRFDGSEVAVTGLPATLSTAQVATSSEGTDRAFAFTPLPSDAKPVDDGDFAFHVFLFVLVALGGLLFVRFRHRALKSVV
jgi:hypothetical protein